MSPDNYSFRLIDLSADLERTSALLCDVFPKATHLTPRYLRWLYLDNPDGAAIGCNAYAAGELVGTMAAMPAAGRLDGAEARGMFMLNGAVHRAHRNRKLQSRISAAIFEEAQSQGYDFCLGTGNKYSTGPLLTRFKLVRQLEARIGIGLPRRRDAEVRASCEHSWSEAAMLWRLANPEARYDVRAAGAGSLITAASGVPGVDAVLYDGREQWPAGRPARRSAPLRLWMGLDPEIDWPRSRYLSIPQRLRASPLNLVFKDLTGGSYLPDPDRFVFRAVDFDPY